jgi:hypothetical protein
MDVINALMHLKQGNKIRNKNWLEGRYLYITNCEICSSDDSCKFNLLLDYVRLFDDHWEVYDDTVPFSDIEIGKKFESNNKLYMKLHYYEGVNAYSVHFFRPVTFSAAARVKHVT